MSLTSDGRILYELKRTWSDGSTHIAFDPMTFLERLAALLLRPRKNLVTYHGVLAPAAGFRDRIVPVTLSRQAACETYRDFRRLTQPEKVTRSSWSGRNSGIGSDSAGPGGRA